MPDRHELGIKIYAESFGVNEADLLPEFISRVGNLYAEEAILAAGGPAWSDPNLTDRDRSIAILSALICEGVLGERLDTHLERAVRNGVNHQALEVLLVLLALYAGQARTSVAAEAIQSFFQKRTKTARNIT
ncbi:MAG: carboxymuconolactone decarboxylase family protein [Luteimonas sp.]|nr:carboxymuconolactone decarboxylase family protein [Luteimonas sp.]